MHVLKPVQVFILSAIILPLGGLLLKSQTSSAVPVYLEPNQPVERRIDDLIARMTLKEKVGQLNLPCVYVDELGKDIPTKLEACKRFGGLFIS